MTDSPALTSIREAFELSTTVPNTQKLFKQFSHDIANFTSQYDQIFEMLADNTSRRVLDWMIKFRIVSFILQDREQSFKTVPPIIAPKVWDGLKDIASKIPESRLQNNLEVDVVENFVLDGYILPSVCDVSSDDVVLDCGGFNGNSSISFSRKCPNGHVYMFEPNPNLHSIARANLSEMKCTNVSIETVGVSDREGKLKFIRDGAASRFSDDGDLSVDVTTIDKWCVTNEIKKVDFIKFDIEGAEQNALRGAREVIRYHRPRLAISLYHRFDDVRVIPSIVSKLGLYEFRMRHNAHSGGEVVLFCSPPPSHPENRVSTGRYEGS